MKILLTGAHGFLGWHTRVRLRALTDHEVVPVGRDEWADLPALAHGCDAVIHLAGVNRGEAEDVEHGNTALARDLTTALTATPSVSRVVFANTIRAGEPTPYGRGKADASALIAQACAERGTTYVDLRLPNLFGEHARANYNGFVATFVERVLDAGAVGINVEDTVHSQDRVREVAEHADYIGALRQAADEADIELVINARTDALFHGTDRFPDPVAEAITRIRACEEAGARCVYPVKIPDAATLATLMEATSLPLNVTAHPVDGAPSGSLQELRDAGVRRVTFGPLLQKALTQSVAELTGPWLGRAGLADQSD